MTDVQRYAKIAGVLFLLSMICGAIGEMYVPGRIIVSSDAAATAQNFQNYKFLFRAGFIAYLVEAICDVSLSLIFYVLLRPVHKNLALLAAFFGLVSTSVFAAAMLVYYAGPILLTSGAHYLNSFSPEQRNTLLLLSIKVYGVGSGVFMAFYGIATGIRGYLIFRSAFLPRFLGVLMMLAGAGFILKNLTLVLVPAIASDIFLVPMMFAALSMTVWLLVKGIDVAKWEESERRRPAGRTAAGSAAF